MRCKSFCFFRGIEPGEETAARIRYMFGGKAAIFYWGLWAAVDFAIEWGFDYLGWWRDF